jgi:RimJ/RimL family protein N-acetyltransferase
MNPPVLDGDDIRLVPLDKDVVNEMRELGQDPDVLRWTYVSAPFTREKAMEWVQRYVDGWKDGSLAGFSIQSPAGDFLGFAALVRVNTEGREGEAGYIVAPQARGKGVATKALADADRLGPIRLRPPEGRAADGRRQPCLHCGCGAQRLPL